jgi:1-deoxy-D-xylulose-5-phosphate reductoisomerase
MKAQLGLPDMKLPIQYAIGYPNRLPNTFKRFNFLEYPNFTFEKPDKDTFRCLALAYEALAIGGNASCILNAANEISVAAFLENKIAFTDIASINEACLLSQSKIKKPVLQDYIDTNNETRKMALSLI